MGLEGIRHFTSSTIAGSAFVITARSRANFLPRQSLGLVSVFKRALVRIHHTSNFTDAGYRASNKTGSAYQSTRMLTEMFDRTVRKRTPKPPATRQPLHGRHLSSEGATPAIPGPQAAKAHGRPSRPALTTLEALTVWASGR